MSTQNTRKVDLLQGTLDVMVLHTLSTMGPLHGYGIARRIEQSSSNQVLLNQGTIYASLVRLQQRGWISAEWGDLHEQPQSQVLLDHQAGSQTAHSRHGELAAAFGCSGRVLATAGEDAQ